MEFCARMSDDDGCFELMCAVAEHGRRRHRQYAFGCASEKLPSARINES